MIPSDRHVAVAFLPAVLIHLGLLAALAAVFTIVPGERMDVLPVLLMTPSEMRQEPLAPSAHEARPEGQQHRPAAVKPVRKATRPASYVQPDIGDPGPLVTIPTGEGPAKDPAPAPDTASALAPLAATASIPLPDVDDIDKKLAQIHAGIQASLVYPPMARIKGISGTVKVRFDVTSSGQPTAIQVVTSSGFPILDEAAVQTVKKAAPYPPIEPTVKVPVVFELD